MSRYHSVPISCVQKPSAACCPALLAASLVVGLGGDDRVGCGGGQGDGEGGGEGCGQGGGAVSRSHWQRVHYLLLHSLAKRPVSPLSRFHVQWISAHLVMVQWYSGTVQQSPLFCPVSTLLAAGVVAWQHCRSKPESKPLALRATRSIPQTNNQHWQHWQHHNQLCLGNHKWEFK